MQSRPGPAQGEYSLARRRLAEQLRASGVRDTRVLRAFDQVPRHRLVEEALWGQAYRDTPLPIGDGQTISAPGVVASMTQALGLEGHERVLEIGTGSGYQAAILSHLVAHVTSVERLDTLARSARRSLDALGVRNVTIFLGDGTQGRHDDAPYDRIVVTAGGPEVPIPLLDQLEIGGLLVGPFGPRDGQELIRLQRTGETRYTREVLGQCHFVDLIGENGWAA